MRFRLAPLSLLVPALTVAQQPPSSEPVWRLDGASPTAGGDRFDRMPPGWHITTTDRGGTLLLEGRMVQGRFAVEVELFLFPNPSEVGFGVVLEHRTESAVAGAMQFLFRRDGSAMAVARHGERDTVLVPWKRDTTIAAHVPAQVTKYVFRVQHDEGFLAFGINGTEVLAVPTDGMDHAAVPGLRVGPGLNLHISRVDLVTPLAPPRPRRRASNE